MKNYYLALVFLLAGSGPALAQLPELNTAAPTATPPPPSRKLAVGLSAGGTYTSFLGSDATNGNATRYKWGYHAGLTADFRLSNTLALHPEVLYVLKGSDFRDATLNRDLTTLDVPILVRFYPTGLSRSNTLFLEAGPQASTLLTAKTEDKTDAKAEFNKVTLDFALGAGYRFASGLSLGFRYNIGVSPVYRQVPAALSGGRGDFQSNARNDVFFLSLGYTMLGRK